MEHSFISMLCPHRLRLLAILTFLWVIQQGFFTMALVTLGLISLCCGGVLYI